MRESMQGGVAILETEISNSIEKLRCRAVCRGTEEPCAQRSLCNYRSAPMAADPLLLPPQPPQWAVAAPASTWYHETHWANASRRLVHAGQVGFWFPHAVFLPMAALHAQHVVLQLAEGRDATSCRCCSCCA